MKKVFHLSSMVETGGGKQTCMLLSEEEAGSFWGGRSPSKMIMSCSPQGFHLVGVATLPTKFMTGQYLPSLMLRRCITSLLASLAGGPPIKEALDAMSPHVRPFYVTRVLAHELPDADIALHFFQWAQRLPGYRHEPEAYDALLLTLIRLKCFHAFSDVFSSMKQEGFDMRRNTAALLIQMFANEKMWAQAVDALSLVGSLGVKLELHTYTTLLDILATEHALNEAMACYREVQKAGYQVKLHNFKTLLNFLGKEGRINEMQELVSDMDKCDICLDKMVYNICIGSFGKAGKLDMAWKFFDRMLKQGFDPDSIALSGLVEFACRAGEADRAGKFIDEMEAKGYSFRTSAYNSLILSFGVAKRPDAALSTFNRLRSKGALFDIDSFNFLFMALKANAETASAWDGFQTMKQERVIPNLLTYNLLIDILTKPGWTRELQETRRRMLKDGYHCSVINQLQYDNRSTVQTRRD
ncbi:hypothetical protein GOP47_0010972 [Adiantum capillus-veneris]|uniref:Pentatricopeptide repeat-containing protein-mitochondrial domain-containing protein n=1 Tax=Adiantum capillus-veneris TaxID=13818 RepID=A0A9D4ZJ79_ADICA|nr:hypothetical protein GOP47_0010972 [Adiantum capillus-veneris]